jgi:hypothetical protein
VQRANERRARPCIHPVWPTTARNVHDNNRPNSPAFLSRRSAAPPPSPPPPLLRWPAFVRHWSCRAHEPIRLDRRLSIRLCPTSRMHSSQISSGPAQLLPLEEALARIGSWRAALRRGPAHKRPAWHDHWRGRRATARPVSRRQARCWSGRFGLDQRFGPWRTSGPKWSEMRARGAGRTASTLFYANMFIVYCCACRDVVVVVVAAPPPLQFYLLDIPGRQWQAE